jgi:hypothetical protein
MSVDIYLEVGKQRTVVGALAWPGWCRIGRNEQAAVEAFVAYGVRYTRVLQAANIAFTPPNSLAELSVVERLAGNASTDFGIPEAVPAYDHMPIDTVEVKHLQALLGACWQAYDTAEQAATGKQLRLGPRGGGRDLEKMAGHVLEAEAAYIARLAWKLPKQVGGSTAEQRSRTRQAALDALAAAARGELPSHGPRGGTFWLPRYFVRRAAWHILDHAWEIEDRIV